MKGGERARGEERLNPANIPLKCNIVQDGKGVGAKAEMPFLSLSVCVRHSQADQ